MAWGMRAGCCSEKQNTEGRESRNRKNSLPHNFPKQEFISKKLKRIACGMRKSERLVIIHKIF